MVLRVLSVAFGVFFLLAVGLGALAPVLASAGYAKVVGLYLFFEPVCRQDLTNSWSYHGISAALCIRCSGAYLGAAVALLRPAQMSLRGFALAAACVACAVALAQIGDAIGSQILDPVDAQQNRLAVFIQDRRSVAVFLDRSQRARCTRTTGHRATARRRTSGAYRALPYPR